MKSSVTITLNIGKAVPHGCTKGTEAIISLWREIDGFFVKHPFMASGQENENAEEYFVTLEVDQLLQVMEQAQKQSQSFDNHRKAFVNDQDVDLSAYLVVTVAVKKREIEIDEAYNVATSFFQQLVLATNIVYPGSFQMLKTHYSGPNAHHYEAQEFDSIIFYEARMSSQSIDWPLVNPPTFEIAWKWLEKRETSSTTVAITTANKGLFTILKLAEQRHRYGARTALLIAYQIEILLNSRHKSLTGTTRNRLRLVLGDLPQSADCFRALEEIRDRFFNGTQPVRRPLLIRRGADEETKEQIGQHNSTVALGAALGLAIIQDLIYHDSFGYDFSESFVRKV